MDFAIHPSGYRKAARCGPWTLPETPIADARERRAAVKCAVRRGMSSTWKKACGPISGERMKAKQAHRLALSAPALVLVKKLKEQKLPETLVFPSPRRKGRE